VEEEMEGGDETEEEMEGGKEETYLSRSRQRRREGESSGGVAFHGEEREMRSVPTSPCFFPVCRGLDQYSGGLGWIDLGQKPIPAFPNAVFGPPEEFAPAWA
jgi:hypothetical protein